MNNKEHLTLEGLHEILEIRVSLNLGFFWWMNKNFTNIQPIERPFLIIDPKITDPNWL
jgi:hypothetical protein